MTRKVTQRTLPVSEQAAEWLVALDAGGLDAAAKREFLAWLKQSPDHIREFLQLTALHVELVQNPELNQTIEELVATATATADVVDLDSANKPEIESSPKRKPRRTWQAAAAVLLSVTLAGGYWLTQEFASDFEGPSTYQTALGEQRSIAFDDGSVIVLNTLSNVRVHYTNDQRRVALLAGEVLFDVAKDPDRPFVVDAGSMQLEVLGTRFNVYRQTEETVLTVVEGEVAVLNADQAGAVATLPDPPITATAGQQVVIENASGVVTQEHIPEASPAIAWIERKLVFKAVPLIEVAEEFNRYNRRPLTINDSGLANRSITGVFNAHDADLLAAFLANQPGVVVEQRDDGIHVRAAEVVEGFAQ